MTVDTTQTVRAAIAAQKAPANQRALFAELLTGAVLIRETMSPGQRVQAILKPRETSDSDTALIADAHPKGLTRGLISERGDHVTPLKLSPNTLLQVIRVMHNHELNQGFVLTDAQAGVSGAITQYMMSSEQVMSIVEVHALLDDARHVVTCAGFIVQLLPEASQEAIAQMVDRMEARPSLGSMLARQGAFDPARLMGELMGDAEHTVLAEEPVFWGCTCDEVRLVSAMATLGQQEIQDIVEEGGFLEVSCEYCGTDYRVGTEQLRGLLAKS